MFIQKDKTTSDVNYCIENVEGWLVHGELKDKINNLYPWFDFIIEDGELIDVAPIERPIEPPKEPELTLEDRITETEILIADILGGAI